MNNDDEKQRSRRSKYTVEELAENTDFTQTEEDQRWFADGSVGNEIIEDEKRPIGFMKGKATLPDDFDSFGDDQIKEMFEGKF